MEKHKIEINAEGNKNDLINFLNCCIKLLKTAKSFENSDNTQGHVSGNMSKENMKFTIKTI